MVNNTCGKTIVVGTIDRDSTVTYEHKLISVHNSTKCMMQNTINTNHKTQFMLSAYSYMFWHQGATLSEFY